MPSKKKKYNSRFPPARIKKIMQTDDEIGKVAAAVPVLISKCLEMFLASILNHTGEVTKSRHAKTMSTSHLKECINNVGMFDFLKDVVVNVADMQNDDEPGTSSTPGDESAIQKTTRKRSTAQPKTPKKRMKTGTERQVSVADEHQTESDEGSMDNMSQDESNGVMSSSMSSAGQSSPKVKGSSPRVDKVEEEVSFHIPLSHLMSSQQPNPPPPPKTPSVKKDLNDEEDWAIDMSIKTTQARCPVIVTNSAVMSQYKSVTVTSSTDSTVKVSGVREQPKVEPNGGLQPGHVSTVVPPHVPHLYRPAVAVPPQPVGNKQTGEIPQGGMLSFLYSPYTGETPQPLNSKGDRPTTQGEGGAPIYPYNPLSAHQHHTLPPPSGHISSKPALSKSSKVDDDDDYDV